MALRDMILERIGAVQSTWVTSLLGLGVLLIALGFVEEATLGNGILAAFLGLYGIVTLVVAALAYGGLFAVKSLSTFSQRRSKST